MGIEKPCPTYDARYTNRALPENTATSSKNKRASEARNLRHKDMIEKTKLPTGLHAHSFKVQPVTHASVSGDGAGGKYLSWVEVDLEIGEVTDAHFHIPTGMDGKLTKNGVLVWSEK